MMVKKDLMKDYESLYTATKDAQLIVVPPMQYLSIKGTGDPENEEDFKNAAETLMRTSEALLDISKSEHKVEYQIPTLEGLFWSDNMGRFTANDKTDWKWEAMMMVPKHLSEADVKNAVKELSDSDLQFLKKVKLVQLDEEHAAQVLYKGELAFSGSEYDSLVNFIDAQGFEFDGKKNKYHEIYLTDFSKADSESMKMIMRQPVE